MTDAPLTDDEALEQISAILQRMDFGPGNLPGGWVLAYEVNGVADGELASNWGFLANASPGAGIGLCHMTQDALTRAWRDDA